VNPISTERHSQAQEEDGHTVQDIGSVFFAARFCIDSSSATTLNQKVRPMVKIHVFSS